MSSGRSAGQVASSVLVAALLTSASASAQVEDEHIYVASFDGNVFDITAGGDLSAATPFATVAGTAESLCWDGSALYVGSLDGNVWDITAGGTFSAGDAFATGLGAATGLECSDGQLLAATFGDASVLDITAGGDFSAAAPFASGLPAALEPFRDLQGRLWTQGGSNLYEITAGGEFGSAAPYATAPGALLFGIAQRSGSLLVANHSGGRVVDFTNGGNLQTATVFAYGPGPTSLLSIGSVFLVADSALQAVFDISAGGIYTNQTPFASGFANLDMGGMEYIHVCGDGVRWLHFEECDGDNLGHPGPTVSCDTDCTAASCGDVTVNPAAGEDCDEGGIESVTCDADCTEVSCGDGTMNVTAGEECDDSNTVSGDGCSDACVVDENTGAGGSGGNGSGGSATGGDGTGPTGSGSGSGGDSGGSSSGETDAGEDDSSCNCSLPGSGTGDRAMVVLLALALTSRKRLKGRARPLAPCR